MAYQKKDFYSDKKRTSGGYKNKKSSKSFLHKAICHDCGKSCTVPFKPSGSKPIFCNNCFEQSGKAPAKKFNSNRGKRFDTDDRMLYEAICDKCQKNCQVPFKPTGDKNVYCSVCFSKGEKNQSLEIIDSKLDQILKLLRANQ